jgi:hypothetical protein
LWKNGWILHQDNAPVHNALSVRQFLAKKQVPVLHHAPYSPNLAPCDFFLPPKLKHSLKGTHFQSIEDIQRKMTDLLKGFTQNDFQKCFHTRKERMQHCIEAQGNYFEGLATYINFNTIFFMKTVSLFNSHTSYFAFSS